MLFAMSAMTGAAPVPVPPPMPAVMNSMSEPSIISAMRSRSSIAASRPISGRAPAPSPRVSAVPSCSCAARGRALQRLRVGVRADELDAEKPSVDHVLDGVAAATSDADDLDVGAACVGWSMISNMVCSFLLSRDAAWTVVVTLTDDMRVVHD